MPDGKFDYNRAGYEKVICNLCGQDRLEPISQVDRYGLPVRTVICRNCGLIFINPRMSRVDYDRFYQMAYREQLEKYKGWSRKIDLDKLFIKTTDLGRELVERIGSHINSGLTLEVGSSCGGVLNGLKLARPDLEIFGLEPSFTEADYASRKNIKTHVSMFENFQEPIPSLKNIFIVRSFNHLLDPAGFIKWSHQQLSSDGKLVIMVIDFLEACRRRGGLKTQIDHPYMFTRETLSSFVENGGFKVEYNVADGDYVYLVAKKDGRVPFGRLEVDLKVYRNVRKNLGRVRLWYHHQFNKLLDLK